MMTALVTWTSSSTSQQHLYIVNVPYLIKSILQSLLTSNVACTVPVNQRSYLQTNSEITKACSYTFMYMYVLICYCFTSTRLEYRSCWFHCVTALPNAGQSEHEESGNFRDLCDTLLLELGQILWIALDPVPQSYICPLLSLLWVRTSWRA